MHLHILAPMTQCQIRTSLMRRTGMCEIGFDDYGYALITVRGNARVTLSLHLVPRSSTTGLLHSTEPRRPRTRDREPVPDGSQVPDNRRNFNWSHDRNTVRILSPPRLNLMCDLRLSVHSHLIGRVNAPSHPITPLRY